MCLQNLIIRKSHNDLPCPIAELERETGFEPATPSLEGSCSSHLSYSRIFRNQGPLSRTASALHSRWWRGEDSNLRSHKTADLQSAPFGHSGTSPRRAEPMSIKCPQIENSPAPNSTTNFRLTIWSWR